MKKHWEGNKRAEIETDGRRGRKNRLYTSINYPICSHECHENILWAVSVKASASEHQSEVFFFFCYCCQTSEIFGFLISMSWQRRYRTNVCVGTRSFFFFFSFNKKNRKRSWSWSSTQTITRWTCSPPADKQWAIHLLPRVWWWSASFHSYTEKKRERERNIRNLCALRGGWAGKTSSCFFRKTYLFITLFI